MMYWLTKYMHKQGKHIPQHCYISYISSSDTGMMHCMADKLHAQTRKAHSTTLLHFLYKLVAVTQG